MEANPTRRITQLRAATRAARAVFLCSAPLVGQPNVGLTGPGLRLACAEPGDQLAIFGEALRELSERATYLYEEAGRYWFSTQPTLNRLADDRAKAFADHEVDEELSKVLRDDARTKGGFHRVFAAPDEASSVDEAEALSLVILSPAVSHTGKNAAQSRATEAVTDAITRCRSGQRRLRNTLFYVAADEAALATAREAMRRAMAWREIAGDERLKSQLPGAQMEDARRKASSYGEGAIQAVRAAWVHILYPVKNDQTEVGRAFDLEQLTISSRERPAVPAAVYDKIGPKGDNVAKEKLGPDNLWNQLKPLWSAERPHLPLSEVAEWFASYVYLPKLKDRLVLDQAVRDAVAKLDPAFGYAERVDEGGRYHGLCWAKGVPDMLLETALLVRADVASASATAPSSGGQKDIGLISNTTGDQNARPTGNEFQRPAKPTRFFGTVEIDTIRPVKAFDAILNAIIMELQRNPSTKVKLTLQVEAEAADGFAEEDIGVIRDNARQLKFKPDSTGFS